MECIYIVFIALLTLQAMLVNAQTYDDSDQLYTDMLNGYNKHIRPVLRQSDILQVNVTYDVINILEINEVEGTMSLLFQFQLFWRDEKITWNPASYNNTYALALPSDSVWTPELILTNAAGTVLKLDSSMSMVRLYSDGLAFWFPTGVLSFTCGINVEYYPFDKQICYLLFTESNYFSAELVLFSLNNEAGLTYYVKNGLWDLVKTEAIVKDTGVQIFEVYLTLDRRPAFIVILVIIPVMFLSILNILVFLLPADSGERMSFTITLLLAQTVFLTIISDNIPATSDPLPILCYFLGLQVLLSMIVSIATLLNLRVYHKDENEPIPVWVCRLLRIKHTSHVHPEGKSNNNFGRGNDSDNTNRKENTGNSGEKEYYMTSTNSQNISRSSSTEISKASWKDISKSLDRVLFIASLSYFLVVFVVFAFITGLREES